MEIYGQVEVRLRDAGSRSGLVLRSRLPQTDPKEISEAT